MKGWVILAVISLFLIGFIAAIDITSMTGGTVNNVSSIRSSENEIQTCLNECPIGCAGPEYRICASDGQKYCNTCAIGCYGLKEVNNSFCENNAEVCCSIIGIYPSAVPFYKMLEKNECSDIGSNGEPIVGAHKEIVSNSFCVNNSASVTARVTTIKANLTANQIKKIITTKNVINAVKDIKSGDCPENCTCTGSTIKCTLASGREMTIVAGNSGNTIVQVKGENMTTHVTLYKSEGKVYGVFKNNETRIVRMLPDQVKDKIKERINTRLENENITLDDNGTYQYQGDKPAKLFFIFPVKVAVQAQVDSQTGEVIKLKTKWWAFLAKDENSEQIVGASCGTVTPGYNDACCMNKGYDVWNNITVQCEFSLSNSSE